MAKDTALLRSYSEDEQTVSKHRPLFCRQTLLLDVDHAELLSGRKAGFKGTAVS